MMRVYPRIREISVEGCEMIGYGGFSSVFHIGADTIAKIYSETYSLETVIQERETAQKAYLAGVPTAISYDVVKCDDCYGIVFELVKAKTLGELLSEDNSRLELGAKYAKLLKNLHTIEQPEGDLPDRKEELIAWVSGVEYLLEASEADEIRAFIASVPDETPSRTAI